MKSILNIVSVNNKIISPVYSDNILFEAPNWLNKNNFIVNQEGRIYNINIKDQSKTHIDTGFATFCNNDHGISPDGTEIVISCADDREEIHWQTSKIYILPVIGGTPRLITKQNGCFWHGWSPDGKKLVYTALRDDQFDIYSINTNGTNETQLTNYKAHNDGAEYSHDGEFIYYNSYYSGSMEIWRMKADGSNKTQLTDDEYSNWFPHPSPDGKYVVYLSYIKNQKEDHPFGKDVKIRMLTVDSGIITDLTKVFFGGQGTINVNSWLRGTHQLAFVSYEI